MLTILKALQKKEFYLEKIMRRFRFALLLLLIPSISHSTIFNVVKDPANQVIVFPGNAPFVPTGGNFTMIDPSGNITAPGSQPVFLLEAQLATNDVLGTFDDSKICTTSTCTDIAMQLATSTPTEFAGAVWQAIGIRVFAPGTYTVEACPPPVNPANNIASDGSTQCAAQASGNTSITFTVASGQLGGHMLFDWNGNANIDVFLVWDINGTFTRAGNTAFGIAENTRTYTLASQDVSFIKGSTVVPADGFPGIGMVDGPFNGSRANFNLFLDGSLTPPPVDISVIGGTVTAGVVTIGGGNVTLDSGNGFSASTTWDWSASDAALLSAVVGNATSENLVFDPSGFASFENLTARVTVTDGSLTASDSIILRMGCIASTQNVDSDGDTVLDNVELCSDTDSDGVLDYLDFINNDATSISTVLAGEEAKTSVGTFALGTLAIKTSDAGANLGSGIVVTATDIGIADNSVEASCVGGCFDFVVTGLASAGSTQVVLPLTVAIPAEAEYKKFVNNNWQAFVEDANNKVESAAKTGGVCPGPGATDYTAGLTAGNECVQLTIEDNGPNDSDSTVDTIADPSGVSQSTVVVVPALETKIKGGSMGLYSFLVLLVAVSFRRKEK